MKCVSRILSVILVLAVGTPATGNLLPPPCEEFHGPITKTLGGTEWEAHFCDGVIVLYSAEGHPTNWFSVVAANGTYSFTVWADATQDAVRAVLHEIAAFTAEEIQAMIEEMKQVK